MKSTTITLSPLTGIWLAVLWATWPVYGFWWALVYALFWPVWFTFRVAEYLLR